MLSNYLVSLSAVSLLCIVSEIFAVRLYLRIHHKKEYETLNEPRQEVIDTEDYELRRKKRSLDNPQFLPVSLAEEEAEQEARPNAEEVRSLLRQSGVSGGGWKVDGDDYDYDDDGDDDSKNTYNDNNSDNDNDNNSDNDNDNSSDNDNNSDSSSSSSSNNGDNDNEDEGEDDDDWYKQRRAAWSVDSIKDGREQLPRDEKTNAGLTHMASNLIQNSLNDKVSMRNSKYAVWASRNGLYVFIPAMTVFTLGHVLCWYFWYIHELKKQRKLDKRRSSRQQYLMTWSM